MHGCMGGGGGVMISIPVKCAYIMGCENITYSYELAFK